MTTVNRTFAGFLSQHDNAVQKIGNYQTKLNVPQTMVDGLHADNLFLHYTQNSRLLIENNGHAWTKFADLLWHGHKGQTLGIPPAAPVLPAAPPAVEPDVENRFIIFANHCKASPNYTLAIGKDLGIDTVDAPFDPQKGQPELKIELHTNHPYLHYIKGKWQGVRIYKDSGDGKGFVKLETITGSNFTDFSPLPAPGTAAIWTYKIVYIWHDTEVGTESLPVAIVVKG